jgi:hypothetical protein
MRSEPEHKPRPIPMLDMRKGAGQAMESISLRVPAEMIEALDHRAGKLRTPRAVLCRNLLAQGLKALQSN